MLLLLLAIGSTSSQGVWPAPLKSSFSGNATVYLSADWQTVSLEMGKSPFIEGGHNYQ